jgi:hypothetical protein
LALPHLRAPRAVLEVAMTAAAKPFETRIADLVRRFGTEHEGEAIATWRALGRLLASRDISFTDLGDGIEKLVTGGLAKAQMEQLFDAGYQKGAEDEARKHLVEETVFGRRPDGTQDWEAIALFCQRAKARLETKHHQFIDDMASRMTWGREPSDRQGIYLLSLFRQLGGRVT